MFIWLDGCVAYYRALVKPYTGTIFFIIGKYMRYDGYVKHVSL